jgi:hypothetical protein
MIDDYAQTMELVRKMEAHLPIPAQPTGACIRALREQGIKLARDQELQIKHVLYLSDEGGISCDVTLSRDAEEAIIVSLTHLRVRRQHPLAQEIRAYQRERTRRLAQSGEPREPYHFTVRPRKKQRRKKRQR